MSGVFKNLFKARDLVFITINFALACIVQFAFTPYLFNTVGEFALSWANSNHWLTELAISLFKNTAYKGLSLLESIPLIGQIFSPSVLPAVVLLGVGCLLASNLVEFYSNTKKLVQRQMPKHTNEKGEEEYQEHTLRNGGLVYWLKIGAKQVEQANSMRFLLSLGVPTFGFMFSCLCGVSPEKALWAMTGLSAVANTLPYGILGALGAGYNAYESASHTFNPKDHNAERAAKAAVAPEPAPAPAPAPEPQAQTQAQAERIANLERQIAELREFVIPPPLERPGSVPLRFEAAAPAAPAPAAVLQAPAPAAPRAAN